MKDLFLTCPSIVVQQHCPRRICSFRTFGSIPDISRPKHTILHPNSNTPTAILETLVPTLMPTDAH